VIHFGEYLATGHSPSMGMGLAPKHHASTGIYPKKVLAEYPCRNPLGEAWFKPGSLDGHIIDLLLTSKTWLLQSGCNHSTAYMDQWKSWE